MKECKKCMVTVSGNFEKCPLCQNKLHGEGENGEVFPRIPIARYEHGLFLKILMLCSVTAAIVTAAVNLMLPESGFWSLFVIAGIACAWLSLTVAVRKRHNILKNITYQATIVSILSVFWDVFTGWRGWSVDFVIPVAFICAMSVTPVLARILKMPTGSYIIYLFLLIVYGIIPAAFVFSGLCNFIYPSMACVVISLISFAALLIFEGKNMTEELKRRLHL